MALTQTQVSQLYVAIFNRASEGSGNAFWQAQADAATAASAMLATDDAQDYFGASLDTDQAFVEHIYLNTLNKTIADDAEGIAFWVEKLEGGSSRGEVVAGLVEAIESYGPDGENFDADDAATVASYNQFTNRVEVSDYMAVEVTNVPANYAQSTAFDGDLLVTDDATTVVSAKAAVDVLAQDDVDPPAPPVEGDTFTLTAGTDRSEDGVSGQTINYLGEGTADNDFFDAPITQNPWAGGVSNSLSSADRLDGGDGTDTLHAELVPEFFGVTGDNQIDVQPRTTSIEEVTFEAREINFDLVGNVAGANGSVTVDAKWMTDINKIGSKFSDADLVIENLTTLTADGVARNTDSITVTMDHTDNVNHDGDASDLTVYFDEDYLLGDQSVQSKAIYYLLDQDADMDDTDVDGDGVVDLLARINTNGLIFTVDGGEEQILEFDQQLLADGTILQHEDFVAALQDSLAALIAAGSVPADTTLTVDSTMTRTTFLDDGTVSSPIPAIVIESKSTTGLESVGFVWVEDLSGEFNVYGRLAEDEGTLDNPIAINVELHKVGRDNDGGDLKIGGKHDEGIPDFYVSVLGAEDKPSNLGTITTNQDNAAIKEAGLDNVYISTHADYVDGETFASLTVRNGFANQSTVDLVDADDFLGDLTLGSVIAVDDLFTLKASGGGDVSFSGLDDVGGVYSYTTGSGNDTFTVTLDGDAVDATSESFAISTGAGIDKVVMSAVEDVTPATPSGVSQNTMQLLGNLSIDTGAGEDKVEINDYQRFDIKAGSDSDFVEINSMGTAGANDGIWTVSTATGAATFVSRVLYQASLTVNFAGFESTVLVETDANGDFVADQNIINNAIMAAIDNTEVPELGRLLTYKLGTTDQQLTIESTVDGLNELSIDLFQPELVTANAATGQVVMQAGDEDDLLAGIVATDAAADSDTVVMTYLNAIDGSLNAAGAAVNATKFNYDFLVENAGTSDDATGVTNVNYSVIDMGSGANDLVSLDSNDDSANILAITGVFGKVSVVNFFDDQARTIVGEHLIDYTSFLTSESSTSGSSLSEDVIPVTLENGVATNNINLQANEVAMLRFAVDATDAAETWGAFNDSVMESLLNETGAYTGFGGDSAYGTVDAAGVVKTINYDDDPAGGSALVNGTANGIVMVENAANLGEYKVFDIDWYAGTTDADSTHLADATLLGTLDFGASINFPLVGNTADMVRYNALIDAADGGAVVPPVDPPVDPPVPGFDETVTVEDLLTYDATTGDNAYVVDMGAGVQIATITGFSAGDALDIDTTTYTADDYLIATTGTDEINFIFGDLTDYTPSWLLNLSDIDATIVAAVEAEADTVAKLGVLDAAFGDWII